MCITNLILIQYKICDILKSSDYLIAQNSELAKGIEDVMEPIPSGLKMNKLIISKSYDCIMIIYFFLLLLLYLRICLV